jgi:predicted RNA binding protein YcfA (HicA-like mRNA interferase family)
MAKLKRLSSRQIIKILQEFGFCVVSVRGSHAKLRREAAGCPPQVLTVPLHRELAPGTVQAVYRQALRFIPEDELRPRFYGPD